MSMLEFPDYTTSAGSSINISSSQNFYIVNASTNLTYILPLIVANGMNYSFSRIDNNSFIVTINIFTPSSNLISANYGSTSTSINLLTSQSFELHSLNNVWYVLYNSDNSISGSAYFSTFVVSNSGNPSISAIPLYFPVPGISSGFRLESFQIVHGSTNSSISYGYYNLGVTTIINTVTTTSSGDPSKSRFYFSQSDINAMPTTNFIFYVSFSVAAFNIYSFVVY